MALIPDFKRMSFRHKNNKPLYYTRNYIRQYLPIQFYQARLQRLLVTPEKPAPLRWLRAQVGQTVRLVSVDDVCYFQSADKYTLVLTRDAELLLRTPLKELIAQLDPDIFWQIHRGTVVNVRQIVAAHTDLLHKTSLTLRDRKEKLPVSRSYSHLFRQM